MEIRSHCEEMLSPRPEIKDVPVRECCYEYISVVSDEFNGRIVKRSEFMIDDARIRNAGFKCSDFALENQIAAGVDLKPAHVSLSTLPYADRMAFEASRLDEFIKSQSSNKE